MAREVLEPRSDKQKELDELKEKLAAMEADNELLKGCIMELADELFN